MTCVVDRSGSMQGEPLDLVKNSVGFVSSQLLSYDFFGLVSYSSDVRFTHTLVCSGGCLGTVETAVLSECRGCRGTECKSPLMHATVETAVSPHRASLQKSGLVPNATST